MRRWPFLVPVILALTLAAALPGSGTALAQGPQPRTAVHPGFGRMVFDFDLPVAYQVHIRDDTLAITFERPAPGPLVNVLEGYVTAIRPSPDRRTVVFPLVKGRALVARGFTSGNAVVVDLSDDPRPPAKAAAPAEPVAAAPAAPAPAATPPAVPAPAEARLPLLPVRLGEHKEFDRLVFDWKAAVPYQVTEQDGRAVVTFRKPARVDLDALRRAVPPALAGIDAKADQATTVVTIPLPAGARPHHFRSGSNVAVDIPRAKPGAAPTPARPAADAPVPAAAVKGAQPAPLAVEPPAAESTKPADTEKNGARKNGAAQKPAAVPAAAPATAPVAKPVPAVLPAEDDEAPAPGDKGNFVSLSFSWNQPVAAAVFRRAGYLWVVFDRLQEVDMNLLRRLGGDVVLSAEQLQHRSATVVRLTTAPGYNPSTRREGLLWIVDLTRQPMRAKTPVDVKIEPESASGLRLLIPVTDGGTSATIIDPEIGDSMVVVPLMGLGQGIQPARNYPDLELPMTVQGIVALPRIDLLGVKATRAEVEITAPNGGLKLSRDAGRLDAMANLAKDSAASQLLDIKAWRRVEDDGYLAERRRLEGMLGQTAQPDQRQIGRMELARFQFAHGLGPEAIGILNVMLADDPTVGNTAPYRALRGAVNFLLRRYEEAVEDLAHPSLSGVEEATFWRAAAEAEIGTPETQAKTLRASVAVARNYPRIIKTPVALAGAKAAIAAADDLGAQNFLDLAKGDNLTADEKAALTFQTGRYNELTGAFDAAIANWEDVERGRNRYYKPRATMARLELLLKLGRIKPGQAAETLDKIRYDWRGDELEFQLMRRLGELQVAEGDYGAGLRTLKHVASYYADNPDAPKLAQMMRDAFDRLYLGGAADALAPVSAIALFDEFKELTPSGDKGDEMIRRLADRLVKVDLLDRAAALLDNQVKFRLNGLEKAKVGTRLALLALFNRQPQSAIDAMTASDMQGLPPDLMRQRRHMTARALADLNRTDEAIALMEGDATEDGRMLTGEIQWKKRNWGAAAAVIESLLEKPKRGETLDEKRARMVLDLATALTLGKDEKGVARIRRTYLQPLQATSVYDAFNFITSGTEKGLLDYRQLPDKIKLAEGFRSFMSTYRERLKTDRLSAIN